METNFSLLYRNISQICIFTEIIFLKKTLIWEMKSMQLEHEVNQSSRLDFKQSEDILLQSSYSKLLWQAVANSKNIQ